MNKKGHGLALLSITVLLVFLFFIWQAHHEEAVVEMTIGTQQNQMIAANYYPEFTKEYMELATKYATYEFLYDQDINPSSCSARIKTPEFQLEFNESFRTEDFLKYISGYRLELLAVEVRIPDYYLNTTFGDEEIIIDGYGYDFICYDDTIYPKVICLDIDVVQNVTTGEVFGREDCLAIHDSDENPNACKVVEFDDFTLDGDMSYDKFECQDNTPHPAEICEVLGETECSLIDGCEFAETYSDEIYAQSLPLEDYQFTIYSNAHFRSVIKCADYENYFNTRKIYDEEPPEEEEEEAV